MLVNLTPLAKYTAPDPTTAEMAEEVNLSEDEFIFLSSVVEAESDRSTATTPEALEGRIMIAATIINRINSSYFPDSVEAVLEQSGQFSTVRNGHSITDRSEYSDQAVILAFQYLEEGRIPTNVLFFNCLGYNYGTPYGNYGGNYFMQYGEEVPYNAN